MSPENLKANEDRIREAVITAIHGSPDEVESLTALICAECEEVRRRIAEDIIGPLIGRYENGLDNDRLEILAHIVRQHYVDERGSIELLSPPKPGGLRRI